MKQSILLLTIILFNIGCDDNPADNKPENRSPEIISLTVFPEVIGSSDSAIVICNAIDPDGDTLVYDWYASGVIGITDAPGVPALFNTYENWHIFYAPDSQYISAPLDSFRISCAARDGIGGQTSKAIYFKVKRQ